MKIQLPDFDYTKFHKVYVGDQCRYATATACACIGKERLITAQFLNKTLYIHNVNDDYKIKSSQKIDYYPDLIDYKDGICISANFPTLGIKNGSLIVYRIEEESIEFVKHIDLGSKKTHGCRIIDSQRALVTSTAENKCIAYVNLENGRVISEFADFEYFPKDIYLVDDDIYISSSESRPARSPVKILRSKLYIYSKDFKHKKAELDFYGQTDALAISGNDIFITLQGQHTVAHFKREKDSLEYVGDISGYSFPHGISSDGVSLYVTNYGDNTVDVVDIQSVFKSSRYVLLH